MTPSIGIDLRAATIVAVVVNEAGQVLEETGAPLSVAAAVELGAKLADTAGPGGAAPIGLAAWEPTLPEVRQVAAGLTHRGCTTVSVAAAALAAAAAETSYGVARDAHCVTCFLVGEHVSAGAIIGGRPWTGAHGAAGSAAWLALNPVERQDYRQSGCLDAEVSASGIVRRLAWRVEAGDLSRVVESAGGLDAVTATHVFDGARAGDGVAISVVRDTARYVGMAVANVVTLFDPEVVVLGGLIAAASDLLLEPVRQETTKRLPPVLADCLRLELPALGERGVAIGAARMATLAKP